MQPRHAVGRSRQVTAKGGICRLVFAQVFFVCKRQLGDAFERSRQSQWRVAMVALIKSRRSKTLALNLPSRFSFGRQVLRQGKLSTGRAGHLA